MDSERHSEQSNNSLPVTEHSPKSVKKKGWFGIIGVVSNFLLARGFSERAVHRLIAALESEDEETSMGAYMALVRLGGKSTPTLLKQAIEGNQTANLLQILGDQGDPEIIPQLQQFRDMPDKAISEAAKDSIEQLKECRSD